MGDAVEEIVAEPDRGGEGGQPPVMESVHPPTLEQQNPWLVKQFYHSFVAVASYGWHVVIVIFVAIMVWRRVRPNYMKWKKKKEEEREAAEYHKNPDVFIGRELAMEAARQRMQEQYCRAAAEHAERMKELEEKKKREGSENREAQLRGEGRSKSKLSTPAASSVSSSSSSSKPSGKPKLRPEYNPLMGGGPTCGWRPARRSGGG